MIRPGPCAAAFLLVVLALLVPPSLAEAAPVVPGGRWPLEGSPRVVQTFDPPAHPYGPGHRGVDLAARAGAPVLTALSGRVVFAGRVAGRGVVSVQTGTLRSTYEPVAAQVAAGDAVTAGDVLGVLATGGHCDGSCLHWGLRSGETYLNPLLAVAGTGRIALVAGDRRATVRREAAARAEIAATASAGLTAGWVAGPGGRHGFGRPVPGGVTSAFGLRLHPVLRVWKLHDGTDLEAGCGTPIRAPAAGRVRGVSTSAGYGHRLLLDHGRVDGLGVVTGYNHATGWVVGAGQQVSRGQLLGYVGRTGFATGCHLHLQVWLDGRLANPTNWFTL